MKKYIFNLELNEPEAAFLVGAILGLNETSKDLIKDKQALNILKKAVKKSNVLGAEIYKAQWTHMQKIIKISATEQFEKLNKK